MIMRVTDIKKPAGIRIGTTTLLFLSYAYGNLIANIRSAVITIMYNRPVSNVQTIIDDTTIFSTGNISGGGNFGRNG